VFQPAEEGLGGAAKMISDEKNPVLEGVDKVFALHLDNSSKAGLVKSGIGLMNANSDRF
jgi:amidohydrolase